MTFDIESMLKPEVYAHPVKRIELIETHISWVVLTGDIVYKIKKPVDFGFLDFSTLERRYEFCEQELQLNRRLAPAIYLDVVAITGTQNNPRIASLDNVDRGRIIEYAVKMAQFPQSAQMDNRLSDGVLTTEDMDAVANMVACFHQNIEVADESMDYGSNNAVFQPVEENFTQINAHLDTAAYLQTLSALFQWSETEFGKLEAVFRQRKKDGFIRECHGDMHLRNLVWLESGPAAFDCIEFNPRLRWIDVMSEVAFLFMDLQDRKQPQLASRFMNSYLEDTGDYAGLLVFPFYLCYRALVRAKVDALRLEQQHITETERKQTVAEFESYLELATAYTQPALPRLIIMRGLSASGKSTVSRQLLETLGAVRIRSDVERKRLFGINTDETAAGDNTTDKIDKGIYTKQASLKTYSKLAELAEIIVRAGFSVIVDAAFLDYSQRKPFQQLASSLAVPYTIIEVTAAPDVLRQRIINRKHDVSDADLVVLEHQLAKQQPLHQHEVNSAITVDTGEELDMTVLAEKIKQLDGV